MGKIGGDESPGNHHKGHHHREDVLKTSWMTKRSQLKSRFSFTNYKDRWFVLTRNSLIYYDGADTLKKKEKGRVPLKEVRLVEQVTLRDESKPHAFQVMPSSNYLNKSKNLSEFQVGYREAGHDYALYIQAKSDSEREEWVQLLRNLCRHNGTLSEKFHPSHWAAGRWLCCGEQRSSPGCQPITWTPRQNKADPVPSLPSAVGGDDSAAAAAAAGGNGEEGNGSFLNAASAGGNSKIVVAVYPFTAIEPGDLTLEKGEEYVVLDDSQDHWWQVQNKQGNVGFIPSNYVKEKDALGLQNYDW